MAIGSAAVAILGHLSMLDTLKAHFPTLYDKAVSLQMLLAVGIAGLVILIIVLAELRKRPQGTMASAPPRSRKWRIEPGGWITVAILLLVIVVYIWFSGPQPSQCKYVDLVHPLLRDAYIQYCKELGSPRPAWKAEGNLVQLELDHGKVLWTNTNFFLLDAIKVEWWMTPEVNIPDSDLWANKKFLRSQFPKCGDHFLYSGWAYIVKNSHNISWDFGCQQWCDTIRNEDVQVQPFDHGYIIGGVINDHKHLERSRQYVLISDNTNNTHGTIKPIIQLSKIPVGRRDPCDYVPDR